MTILTLAPLGLHTLTSTDVEAVPTIMMVAAAALYLWGVWRVNRLHPRHRWSRWRTAAFLAGLACTAIAVESVIGVYDDALFYDHMLQHLLLIMVAAPLFAMGTPVLLAFRASTGRVHELVTAGLRSRVSRLLGNPIVAFVLYAIVIPLTHLTSFYDYTLTHESVHDTEHLLFLFVGYLFWRQVVGIEPGAKRLHPGVRLAYLAFAVPVDTFTGLSLANESHEIFPAYLRMHRPWGPSMVTDLHLGGVVMWVGGDSLMLLAMIPVAVAWLHYEERRAVRVDRELDAILPA